MIPGETFSGPDAGRSPDRPLPGRDLLSDLLARLAEARRFATGVAAASIDALQRDIEHAVDLAGPPTDLPHESMTDEGWEPPGLDCLLDAGGLTSSGATSLHGRMSDPAPMGASPRSRRHRDAGES